MQKYRKVALVVLMYTTTIGPPEVFAGLLKYSFDCARLAAAQELLAQSLHACICHISMLCMYIMYITTVFFDYVFL